MRVVFDSRAISNQLDGIGRYSLNLVNELVREAPGLRPELLVRHDLSREMRSRLPSETRIHEVPLSHVNPRSLFRLGRLVDSLGADLYHSPFLFQPLMMRTPGIISIHDTMWLRDPALQAAGRPMTLVAGWIYYRVFSGLCLRKAHACIANSKATLTDIVKWAPWASNKTYMIPPGLDTIFHRDIHRERCSEALAKMGLQNTPFLLHVTNAKPYKNTDRVIKAFATVASDVPHSLVIVGRASAFTGDVHREIRQLHMEQRIRYLGSVTDEDLIILMKCSTALLFPSRYEGFGLPVIESMACACPVLTSSCPALKETAGDAALIVDPEDETSIARGISDLIHDPNLRSRLVKLGLERASTFEWSGAARSVLDLYEELRKNLSRTRSKTS